MIYIFDRVCIKAADAFILVNIVKHDEELPFSRFFVFVVAAGAVFARGIVKQRQLDRNYYLSILRHVDIRFLLSER